jgi:hypothetical protein
VGGEAMTIVAVDFDRDGVISFLIQYDRKRGQLVSVDAFPGRSKHRAEEARLSMELMLLGRQDRFEIVLIEAKSEVELRKTHRRYFERLDQLTSECRNRQLQFNRIL